MSGVYSNPSTLLCGVLFDNTPHLWCVVATTKPAPPKPPLTRARSSANPNAEPSTGSVPVPTSSSSTKLAPSDSARIAYVFNGCAVFGTVHFFYMSRHHIHTHVSLTPYCVYHQSDWSHLYAPQMAAKGGQGRFQALLVTHVGKHRGDGWKDNRVLGRHGDATLCHEHRQADCLLGEDDWCLASLTRNRVRCYDTAFDQLCSTLMYLDGGRLPSRVGPSDDERPQPRGNTHVNRNRSRHWLLRGGGLLRGGLASAEPSAGRGAPCQAPTLLLVSKVRCKQQRVPGEVAQHVVVAVQRG